MARKDVPIKLNSSEMNALASAHIFGVPRYEATNDHELLLLHHMIAFREKYTRMLLNDQKNYTVKFNAVDALAFCQIWAPVNLAELKYEGLIIQRVLNAIDKYRKSLEATADMYKDV